MIDRTRKFLIDDSGFLIVGTIIALAWVNVEVFITHTHTYERFTQFELKHMFEDPAVVHAHAEQDHLEGHGEHHGHPITVQFVASAFLMAFFFATAGKEVWESFLPGGPLSKPREAAVPIIATIGGVAGPAATYALIIFAYGVFRTYVPGTAIPCATDIAFSYLFAKKILGASHPAIAFLLLLAILDDAAGLVIIAVFYSAGGLELHWLLLSVLMMAFAFVCRKLINGHAAHSHWVYLPLMLVSWYGFFRSGIEPALGFIPIIPCMPHADTDLGIYAHGESMRDNTLDKFEHFWKPYIEVFLGLFALANAGVACTNIGLGTLFVFVGLIVGKTAFITGATWFAVKVCKLPLPKKMDFRHVLIVAMIAAIGFTVSLFISTKAFEPGVIQEEVKMGALLSFAAGFIAIAMAKLLGVKPLQDDEEEGESQPLPQPA